MMHIHTYIERELTCVNKTHNLPQNQNPKKFIFTKIETLKKLILRAVGGLQTRFGGGYVYWIQTSPETSSIVAIEVVAGFRQMM